MARWNTDLVSDASAKAWTSKSHWDDLVAECYEHAMPGRNPYHANGTGTPQGKSGQKGKDKTSRKVFDSTLMNDAIRITNRIQYELFPIGSQWASFVPGAFVGSQQQEQARQDLHSLQQVVFTAIEFSNFDLAIAEWLQELVVAGTACMLILPGDEDNPVVYQAVTQSHVALREGALGKIDLISRQHKMRLSLIEQTWSDTTLPELSAEELKDDPEVSLIDVCYYVAKDRKWYYDVLITGGLKSKDQKRVVEREYDISPWVVSRWNKAAEEVQGRSLVMQALPDARVLSAVKSYLLRHAALAIGGVFMVRNDGVVNANNVRVFPGATIPVRSTGGPAGASIAPLQVTGDVNLTDLVIRDLVGSIHKTMLNDGMPEISDGIRTATELMERLREFQQTLGAPFARILKEGIIPTLEATIAILADAGVIPVQAGNKIKLNNGQIKVKFASPLVQGQSIREVEAARNAMAITRESAGEDAVGLNYKIEDFGAWVGGKMGVVPDIMRTKPEREKLQQQAAQVAVAQQTGEVPSVGGTGGVLPGGAPQQQPANNSVPLAA